MPSRAGELRTVKKLLRKFCKIKLVTSEGYEFNEKKLLSLYWLRPAR